MKVTAKIVKATSTSMSVKPRCPRFALAPEMVSSAVPGIVHLLGKGNLPGQPSDLNLQFLLRTFHRHDTTGGTSIREETNCTLIFSTEFFTRCREANIDIIAKSSYLSLACDAIAPFAKVEEEHHFFVARDRPSSSLAQSVGYIARCRTYLE